MEILTPITPLPTLLNYYTMRDLKFRLWNPDRKVITGGNELNTILWTTDGEFVKEFTRNGMVWMQFTGLQDKNGKDIYEGDILLDSDNIQYPSEGDKGSYHEVKFEDGSFCWKGEVTKTYNSFFSDPVHLVMEIAGNIYENPELLTPLNQHTPNTQKI